MSVAHKNGNYVNNCLPATIDNLTETLKGDKQACYNADIQTMWYHGKMTREGAEKILFEVIKNCPDMDTDGMFLVRDSTASDVDLSLSFLFDRSCYHFYIKRMKEGYYCIDGGPVIQGLEMLMEHYMEAADRLPTSLSKLCRGKPPPAHVRKTGPTNMLHRVVNEGNEALLKKILIHPLCPDVNAKDQKGSTALHNAALQGFDRGILLLLSHGADLKIKDKDSDTALHKACSNDLFTVSGLLVNHDITCVQERCPNTGWVPLHVAATHGHMQCVKLLLKSGAAVYPRGTNSETPIELAENYRRKACIQYLENFKGPDITMEKDRWLHTVFDRQDTETLFRERGLYNGLFLISKSDDHHYRLSLCFSEMVKHFKILLTMYRGRSMYFIDDGPYHLTLEALVEYYHRFEDGFPVTLKYPVSAEILPKAPLLKKPSNSPSPNGASLPRSLAVKSVSQPQSPTPKGASKETPSPALDNTATTSKNQGLQNSDALKVIQRKNLKLGSELGTGEYGSVLKGVFTVEKNFFSKEKINVAIKQFHRVGSIDDFQQEAHVMQSLKHEFITELLGVCHGPPLMLVEEFVPMGSMLSYLEDYPERISVKQELYLWAAQIAEGMMYLETMRLVHRDLAARNILLRTLQHAKISDFGLSRAMGTDKEYYKASKGGRWPIKWYAPESVNFGHFSHASDVWSYAVTLWEMFSYGAAPYENMTGFEVVKFLEDEQRLSCPEKCPDGVYEVMLKCWCASPADRPTFQSLNRHFDEEPEYASVKELRRATVRRI